MTIDKSALKALAEAATQGEWTRDTRKFGGVVYGGPIQHWVNGSGQSQVAMTTGADWMRPGETEANADFIAAANPAAVLALLAEIDRLEGARPDAPPRPPEGEGLPRYGLRWNGPTSPITVPMPDGYWTPWHLADQLKAENEALRKQMPSAEIIWCACGDGYAANSYGAGFMDANGGVCANCDAASQSVEPDLDALRKDAERNNRMLVSAAITIGEICEALGIDNHSEPDMIVEAVRELKSKAN